MSRAFLIALALCTMAAAAKAQVRSQLESRSHITVLVDLSATWLNNASKDANKRELEVVADSIAALAPDLKPPIEVRYLEIGDASLSRAPLCEARFMPNIFRTTDDASEFADLQKMLQFFREDCTRIVLMHRPQSFTDITGAFGTVSRIYANEAPGYNAIIALSDFKEERRKRQTGNVGALKGVHALLLYRVLDPDRLNPAHLDGRVATWLGVLRASGATVVALDDISLEPAKMKRLLTQ